VQADAENKGPTDQQNQGVDETPNPAHRGAYEALLKIAPNQLKKQTSTLDQIAQKKLSGQASGQAES